MKCLETPACVTACKALPKERPRWFTGRPLTARDLIDADAWLLARLRLRNRLFHGHGIACGLDVSCHPNPACRKGWIVVGPGIALDCCGREIMVCDEVAVEVDPRAGREGPWILCLRYAEMFLEPQPVLVSEDGCDVGELVPSRMRESYVLEAVPRHELPEGCWPENSGKECPPCEDEAPGDCFTPACPCGDCIPLALLSVDPDSGELVIDEDARPTLASTHQALTHVCSMNWPHGGEVTLDELAAWGRRLVVGFDRPLRARDLRPGTGIGMETFRVTYREAQAADEMIVPDTDPGLESEEGTGRCRAVYTIPERFLERRRYSLIDNIITVTLRCDFILDIHGNPVDGEHLRGLLPSGDGTAGGDFVSWFRVVEGRDGKEQAR